VLKKHTGSRVTVFAVWEPILMTDMQRPGTSIMARIGDPRVRQFWDPDHAVAAAMKAGLKTRPDCCESDGVLWDLAAVYGSPVAGHASRTRLYRRHHREGPGGSGIGHRKVVSLNL